MKAEQSRATKPTGQLPAGVYWIGDLSYVIADFFDQGLYKLEGVHRTQEGESFAIYVTEQGDGIFEDNDGDDYGSDAGNLGCIPIDAIDQVADLGHLVRFHSPFVCRWIEEGGFICFGDLAIKTDSLSEAEYPDATILLQEQSDETNFEHAAEQPTCTASAHIKIDPYDLMDLILRDLILRDEAEADSDAQLVMHEIADLLACGGRLFGYADYDDELKESLIRIFNLMFHSGLDEFTDFFRGYLVFHSGLEDKIHDRNLEEARTKTELYAFLEKLDWSRIFELCRRHCDVDSVARLFQAWTGFAYAAERERYPVEAWDGTPRWPMENGKYLPSE
jgi:hypothetical protein